MWIKVPLIISGNCVFFALNWPISLFSGDSSRLITGSADQTVKLWDVKRGEQLYTYNFDAPARSVEFSVGDKLAVITTDTFMEKTSAIHVKRIAEDIDERKLHFLTVYFVSATFYLFVIFFDENLFVIFTWWCWRVVCLNYYPPISTVLQKQRN